MNFVNEVKHLQKVISFNIIFKISIHVKGAIDWQSPAQLRKGGAEMTPKMRKYVDNFELQEDAFEQMVSRASVSLMELGSTNSLIREEKVVI